MRFLMIDRITQLECGAHARAIKAVASSEDYLADQFPGNPIMPAVLIIEAMVQTAAALLALSTDFAKAALLSSAEHARFRALVRPGDVLEINVDVATQDAHTARIRARALVAGTPVAAALLDFALIPADCIVGPGHLDAWRQLVSGLVQGAEVALAVH